MSRAVLELMLFFSFFLLLATATPLDSMESSEELIASAELFPENRKRSSENEPSELVAGASETAGERSTTGCLMQSAQFYRQCLATCRTISRRLPHADDAAVSRKRHTYHRCRRASCPEAAARIYMDCVGEAFWEAIAREQAARSKSYSIWTSIDRSQTASRSVPSGPVPTTSWRPTKQFVHVETNRTLNSRYARPSFSRSVLSTHCSCIVLVCRNVIYSYIRLMI